MEEITTIGLDIAKHVFQVHGINGAEAITNMVRIHNDVVREYLDLEMRITSWAGAELRRFLPDMDALMGGHYDWARQQKRYGD